MKLSGALAAGVLVAAAGGAVIAHAAGSTAKATTGGLAITGGIIRHQARAGQVDSVTLANNSKQSLTISVAARPWVQASTGRVVANRKATLSGVVLGAASFTLAPGATKDLTVTLASVPAAGYLYGGLEVIGMPPNAKAKGIVTAYRLISALRYTPATLDLRLEGRQRQGDHARRLAACSCCR